jgi:hypothetical protein
MIDNKKSSLKDLGLLITTILVLLSCSTLPKNGNKDNISGVTVTQFFPLFDGKGVFLKNDTSHANIYYYKDMVLYDDSLIWNTYWQGIRTKAEMLPNFFVVTKGKNYGCLYSTCREGMDSCTGSYEKKLPADSFLKEQWYSKFTLSTADFTLLTQQFNKESGIMHREYFVRDKKDTIASGKLILSFSNRLPKVAYCLYKQLDTVQNMKLCKVKTVVDIRPMKTYAGGDDSIVISSELSEAIIKNKNELLQYFERAKQNELKEQKGKL